ncbi:hypothetical protein MVEN_01720700 [Mycena venus]|uniref:Uncharacterized protein n=1 Tax=Mycena venus TaxID=2733690 RepID=A0A8H7CQA0_9AGAR|nr:hypothetical protein MVEN_01720700 [Mycena venus]
MRRPHFRAPPSQELYLLQASSDIKDDIAPETLISSETAFATALYRMSQEELEELPKRSVLQSSSSLRLLSVILHSTLIVIHLVLLGVWAKELQHNVVFSLEHQKLASLFITSITTTFGTVYSAVLVFLTQTLSLRRSLHVDQMLTATHDNAAAWSGIGSAVVYLWHQRTVRASLVSVLFAVLYLGNILGLHVTTPALFSLEAFNSNRFVPVGTNSLVALNSSIDLSDAAEVNTALSSMDAYASQSFYLLPSIFGSSTNLGLHQGTLYDEVDDNPGVGEMTVDAKGFAVSCGYVPGVQVQFGQDILGGAEWTFKLPDGSVYYDVHGEPFVADYRVGSTLPGVISALGRGPAGFTFYSTIPILDSSGSNGSSVELVPAWNANTEYAISEVQVFECSMELVDQTGLVDSQSHKISPGSIIPSIRKTSSTWTASGSVNVSATGTNSKSNLFIDDWSRWYSAIPGSDFPRDKTPGGQTSVSIADLYIIETLNLHPANIDDAPTSVNLHELENCLSTIVASMFWSLGHSPPQYEYNTTLLPVNWTDVSLTTTATQALTTADVAHTYVGLDNVVARPQILRGNATATQVISQVRLELSIIAVAVGLAASICLLVVSLSISGCKIREGSKSGEFEETDIDGAGILHVIWLYRNHPELHALLEQVDHPTNQTLREAGMVRTRLVGRCPVGRDRLSR